MAILPHSLLPKQNKFLSSFLFFLLIFCILSYSLLPSQMMTSQALSQVDHSKRTGRHPQAVGYRSPRGKHKLRVTDPSIARALESRNARMIGNYDSFQIFVADEQTTERFAGSSFVELRDEENLILFNAGALDTTSEEVKPLQAGTNLRETSASGESSLHLVQFAASIKPEWYAALQNTGVKIVAYIPNNAYLVYGTPQNLARVHDLSNRASYVQWEGTYQPRFKLDPNVRTGNKGINPGS